MFDITVTIIFHREGSFAIPALESLRDLVLKTRANGLRVEARAILDNADMLTRNIVAHRGAWLDDSEDVSFGDLGLSRNRGVELAHGKFLSFLDGDDLWGEDWLILAHAAATANESNAENIWHPESLFYFNEGDFDRHSINHQPHPSASAFHFFHQSTNDVDFNRNALLLNNIWSANVFASRDLHLRIPYKPVDKLGGFGVEDWSWNIETVWAKVPHCVVLDTIHLIRVKESGSLGQQNTAEGLLVNLTENVLHDFSKAKSR